MLKVSHDDLSFLAPQRGTKETYPSKIEKFLKEKGHAVPVLSENDQARLKESALNYWRDNKHENLTEAAWLHAYCTLLKIELDLSFKR